MSVRELSELVFCAIYGRGLEATNRKMRGGVPAQAALVFKMTGTPVGASD